MKILQVFSMFSIEKGGGTVDLIYKITRELAHKGHDVTIYTGNYGFNRAYTQPLNDLGVDVQVFTNKKLFKGIHYMVDLKDAELDFMSRYDIVHFHAHRSYQNFILGNWAKKYNIPYVVDSHGSAPIKGGTSSKAVLKILYDIAIGNSFQNHCGGFIAESPLGINEYKELGIPEDKIHLVQPSFPLEDFEILPPKGLFRAKYGLQGKKIITFFGRLNEIKGPDILLGEFNSMLSNNLSTDLHLVFVGPDDGMLLLLKSVLREGPKSLQDNVTFTGGLFGQDKLEALVDSNVVVQPSRYEQGAWSPFEAILCGTPIIVSRHTGSGEDTMRANAGETFDIDTPGDLSFVISRLLSNPDRAKAMTEQGATYIKANLSLKENIKGYEEVYRKVINQNGI